MYKKLLKKKLKKERSKPVGVRWTGRGPPRTGFSVKGITAARTKGLTITNSGDGALQNT
jgi:hypothetical protein